jgi:hypothetical protein
MKVWLIGESNPYQTPESDPEHHFALYPDPPNSAGGRLCRALKLPDAEYLKRYQRRNLLHTVKWSVPAARRAAATILGAVAERDAVVLLGAKVAAAFGVPFDVLKTHQRLVHGEVLYTLLLTRADCPAYGTSDRCENGW